MGRCPPRRENRGRRTLLIHIFCIECSSVSTYFPASDTEEEAQDVGLLLLLKLLDVLEGTHFGCSIDEKLASNLFRENLEVGGRRTNRFGGELGGCR